jgi:hypothetical protein
MVPLNRSVSMELSLSNLGKNELQSLHVYDQDHGITCSHSRPVRLVCTRDAARRGGASSFVHVAWTDLQQFLGPDVARKPLR